MPTILAIESSCDDTSAAVCKDGKILANVIASQAVHEAWGGVVPELASRAHMKNIIVTVDTAMQKAGVKQTELDAIAFTRGPGLIGSLLVGVSFAKGLAMALNLPLIEVNHMQAHVMANFIDETPAYPHICMTVSGGHTQIILVKGPLEMEVIGETIDDAAGEAFDKSAKILELPYPGGPLIDKRSKEGDAERFKFAKPQIPEYDFSFSGLKTSILYFVQAETRKDPDFVAKNMNDLCASIQKTIVDILLKKLEAAVIAHGVKEIALAGGVSANSELRERFAALANKHGWRAYIPKFEYCTDNAGMIAKVAEYKFERKEFCGLDVEPLARYAL
ncbi:MAG: tRNA (adenosine(37)-N6)-threonylcarbamoyltransferase complex transferase subunit TsaD [Bacteroidetes bacterium]|nr:tRNA (adenosine(37)-N6)-threonylcarbamoyltransferase complex transferase subunit TsaD [Bacteroidota bacterium]